MRYEFSIAARYLWMARHRAHTAFLTIISTLGLAVGVATLLISLALLSGLQGKIKARLIAQTPQLLIEPTGGNSIANAPEVVSVLKSEAGTRVDQLISGIAWASSPRGDVGRPVRIRSYEGGSEPRADYAFGRSWEIESSPDSPSIFLRRDFANSIGIFLNDDVVIVAPRMRLTPFGSVPIWKRYRVTRIIGLTDEEQAPEAWVNLEEASALFGTGGKPSSIQVFANLAAADRLQKRLTSEFPSLLVQSWRELNRPLFLALRLEKIVMFATISLIIFVAALNLISSISMLIVEKRPQVGILQTLGASQRSILTVFLCVGLLIGLIGTVVGNAIGLGVSWAANRYGLIPLPGDVSYMSHIPFSIDLMDVLAVNAIAVVLTILATWYPASTASKLDPITAIRDV